ncbi:signal peptidase I [Eubacteriales bacterium KG125]
MKIFFKEIAIAAVVSFIIMQFIRSIGVSGRSMEPTLSSGDGVFVSRVAYKRKGPERGDVIVFKSNLKDNRGRRKFLIKRVIGLPGEEIKISDGRVFINGKELVDNVSLEGMEGYNMRPREIPKGKYYCMGDNRLHSTDSRSEEVGSIPINKILGKVVYRWNPLERIGAVKTRV